VHCKVCCSTTKCVHQMVLGYHPGNPHAQWHAWEGSTLVPLPQDKSATSTCHRYAPQHKRNQLNQANEPVHAAARPKMRFMAMH
jgi:hypothetical protein